MSIDPGTGEILAAIDRSRLSDDDKLHLCNVFILQAKHASEMTPAEMGQARALAGLSVGQAARLLGILRAELVAIEQGWRPWFLSPTLRRMDEVYGLGPPPLSGRAP